MRLSFLKPKFLVVFACAGLALGLAFPRAHAALASLAEIQADTVLALNTLNVAHLEGLERCLCEKTGEDTPRCRELESSDGIISFNHFLINVQGETKRKDLNCETATQRLLRARVEAAFPEMAHALALRAPKIRAYHSESERLDTTDAFHFQPSPAHPIDAWGVVPSNIAKPKIDERGLGIIRREYAKASRTYCADFMKRDGIKDRVARDPFGRDPDRICAALLGDVKDFSEERLLTEGFKDYYNYANHRRETEFRLEATALYVQRVDQNPLLLLLDNAHPSDLALLRAVAEISVNARAREKHFRDLYRDGRGELDPEFTRFSGAYPYTIVRARKLGYENKEISAAVASWTKEAQTSASRHALVEAGVMAAMAIGCLSPWGKLGQLALSPLFRAGCLAGIGLPLNTYFLADGFFHYRGAVELALSSLEPGQQANSIAAAESAKRNLQLIALLWPVGLNLRQGETAARQIAELLRHP